MMQKRSIRMRPLTVALCATLGIIACTKKQDQAGAKLAGVELGEVRTVTANVVAVDKMDSTLTLTGPEGNLLYIAVDDQVQNFGQIEAGDQVNVNYYEGVAIYLGAPGEQPEGDAAQIVATARKGEKPAGMAVDVVDVAATVQAIDQAARTVTVKGPEGNVVKVKVDPSVKAFDRLKVGDSIHARYTEALAIAVEKP